eukprot:CCRYP_012590-RA/>CCRYP_012590-RA protein AED:0.39 eAED:1.00 QI:0/-1/0/1/-1/0/1/0/18
MTSLQNPRQSKTQQRKPQ